MPWKATCAMSLRREFVTLAAAAGANMSELCRRFGISRKTGYKWLRRSAADDSSGLADRSRRPRTSPRRTPAVVEERVLRLRDKHPAWGGRKLRAVLEREDATAVPAVATITEILRRHGRLDESAAGRHRAFMRFERAAPNELWQMDFKGHFGLGDGARCHPLTVLDDHSRFNVGLRACDNERGETVRGELTAMFRRYGLPRQMLMDNGSPWGGDEGGVTPLTVWLLRQGIAVTHGRPYHPQTQGKEERFHRTLKVELVRDGEFRNLADCQPRFDPWRETYNFERPHEALDLAVPGSRYRPSERSFRETLPPLEYAPDCEVRKVQHEGLFSFRGREFRIAKAFRGQPIGLRPTTVDGRWNVLFDTVVWGYVDLTSTDDVVRREETNDARPSVPSPFAPLTPPKPTA